MAVKRKSNKAMNEAAEEGKTDVCAASGVNGGAAEDKSKPVGRAAMMDGADVEEVTTGKAVMTDGADGAEVAGGVSGCAGGKAAMNNVTDRAGKSKSAAKDKSKTAGRAAMMDGADVEEVTTGKAVMTDGADGAEVAGGVSGCAGGKAAMNNVTDRAGKSKSAAKDKSKTAGRAAMVNEADGEEVTTGEVVMTDGADGAEVAGGVSGCAGGKATEEGKTAKGKAGGQKAVSAISPALVGAVCTALRNGLSLYAACRASGVDTRVFYQALADNPAARESYRLALADYADRCTDAIRQIVAELRAGEIDNPTAKLLIETEKWLAQKACPEAVQESFLEEEERDGVKEIVVHFV